MMQAGIPDRFQQGDCGDGDGIVRGNGRNAVGHCVARSMFENVIRLLVKTLSKMWRRPVHACPAGVHDCQELIAPR